MLKKILYSDISLLKQCKKTFFTHNFGIKIPSHQNWQFYEFIKFENKKTNFKKLCHIFFLRNSDERIICLIKRIKAECLFETFCRELPCVR